MDTSEYGQKRARKNEWEKELVSILVWLPRASLIVPEDIYVRISDIVEYHAKHSPQKTQCILDDAFDALVECANKEQDSRLILLVLRLCTQRVIISDSGLNNNVISRISSRERISSPDNLLLLGAAETLHRVPSIAIKSFEDDNHIVQFLSRLVNSSNIDVGIYRVHLFLFLVIVTSLNLFVFLQSSQ
jgi:hypothetical protein